MRLSRAGSALASVLLLGSACSLVTGSGDLEFNRDEEPVVGDGDGDAVGGNSGLGGDAPGGMNGDGDGDASGGMSSLGGAASGGEGSGGDGSGGAPAFTGVSYNFDSGMEGWSQEAGDGGWGEDPALRVVNDKLHAEFFCEVSPPCEAVFSVQLDPPAPLDGLVLLAGYTMDVDSSEVYDCQLGTICAQDWLWSEAFDCSDLIDALAAWELHTEANPTCSAQAFGFKITANVIANAIFDMDFLGLNPPGD